jgi:hypothetical protein
MTEQLMQLKFKGLREYVHGTDMFNETLDWLSAEKGEIKDIDFALHRVATHQLKVILGDVPPEERPVAVCAFTSGGVRERAYLMETDVDITERYPYPEDEIVSSLAFDTTGRKGVLQGDSGYSDIEIWVAMCKAVHLKTLPQLSGKWLFARARFPRYENHAGAHERTLTIAATFNEKLTRSEVVLDGEKVGEIYFSMV